MVSSSSLATRMVLSRPRIVYSFALWAARPVDSAALRAASRVTSKASVAARLTVEAALTGKREHIYHAAMLDPHTAAELSLDQIWSLVDDLIEAHGEWLPEYA